ncbi:MAG: T9SS type A sorting domain-containing protein, partial [Fibrobacter sp.]|nr:T9SS type A sorting domain-containing protein [Fibrobacter sp.]
MVKKPFYLMLLISFFFFLPVNAQQGLRGRVIDKDYKPIQGAIVKIIIANKQTTTDQNGSFFIEKPSTHVLPDNQLPKLISFQNGILTFYSSVNQQQIQVDVFDTRGQKISSLRDVQNNGKYTARIIPPHLPAAVYFVKFTAGVQVGVFKIMNFKAQTYALSSQGYYYEKSSFDKSAATLAVVDTLSITKDGYKVLKQSISSYEANLNDIKLESNSSNDQGLPPVTNGRSGKTTRYWDCCKPHCGWHSNMKMCDQNGSPIGDKNAKSSCEGGPAFQC